MTVSLEKSTETAAKVKVVGMVNLTQKTTRQARRATLASVIKNNIPATLRPGSKKYDFRDLTTCLAFLRDNCQGKLAIDVRICAAKKVEGDYSLRQLAALDALKNHHKYKIIAVATLED